jgi:hypothetical protein
MIPNEIIQRYFLLIFQYDSSRDLCLDFLLMPKNNKKYIKMTTYIGCDKIHAPKDYKSNESKWVLHVLLVSFAFTLHLVEHGNKCPW